MVCVRSSEINNGYGDDNVNEGGVDSFSDGDTNGNCGDEDKSTEGSDTNSDGGTNNDL